MRKQLLLVLLSVGGMISPARAQFIGYTSPQTVQQTLATSIACTGSTQTYPINNLGQTQHYLSIANISTGTTQLQAAIQGVDVQGNVFQISDVLELGGSNLGSRQGNLTASGYFPKIQVAITCSPNTGTYSASYSGAWGTFNVNAGAYLTAQIDKVSFSGADATVNQTNIFQTPFGSSSGTLLFKYGGTSGAGGSLLVTCIGNGIGIGGAVTVLSTALANNTTLQTFQIPDQPCIFATVAYTSGGGGTLVNVEYIFNVPGRNAGGGSIGSVTQGTSPWVVSGTVTANQGTLNLGASVLSGQQAVTNADVALATNTLAHGICVAALSTNAASIFIGTTGVTTATGLELPAKASVCLSVSNSNAVHVIAAAGGSSVTWVGN